MRRCLARAADPSAGIRSASSLGPVGTAVSRPDHVPLGRPVDYSKTGCRPSRRARSPPAAPAASRTPSAPLADLHLGADARPAVGDDGALRRSDARHARVVHVAAARPGLGVGGHPLVLAVDRAGARRRPGLGPPPVHQLAELLRLRRRPGPRTPRNPRRCRKSSQRSVSKSLPFSWPEPPPSSPSHQIAGRRAARNVLHAWWSAW